MYEWRNVPRSDGYSPAQLLFGRAQRTSLPTISCQNRPINFESAASAKDAAHARSKLDHDKSKLSLSRLSPGQDVFLQDSKSSAWDKRGVRPDNLSYIIRSDNKHFTPPPRRLLHPVPSATPLISTSPGTPSSEPVTLRRSSRLQGRAPSAQVHFSESNTSLRQLTSPSSQQWLPSSRTDKASSTRCINNASSNNTLKSTASQLTATPLLSTPKMLLTSPSSPTLQTRVRHYRLLRPCLPRPIQ